MIDGSGPQRRELATAGDIELVAALRRNDERAFEVLVDRYHAALTHLAMAYVGDRAAAEDAAQDAWIALLNGLDRFAERASLRTWLFGILINCARSSRRKTARSLSFSDLADTLNGSDAAFDPDRFLPAGYRWEGHWSAPPEAWPEERLLEEEALSMVHQAIAHLPPRQRAVLTLRDIEGWPSTEICALFGISDANERVLLHRARGKVRRELAQYLAPSG